MISDEQMRSVLALPTKKQRIAALASLDWTVDPKDGISNSSPTYKAIVQEVTRIIFNSGYTLLNGGAESVARLIVSQLAHQYGLAPKQCQK